MLIIIDKGVKYVLKKSFYFYNEVDDYSGLYSDNLNDFVEKIMIVNLKSLLLVFNEVNK